MRKDQNKKPGVKSKMYIKKDKGRRGLREQF